MTGGTAERRVDRGGTLEAPPRTTRGTVLSVAAVTLPAAFQALGTELGNVWRGTRHRIRAALLLFPRSMSRLWWGRSSCLCTGLSAVLASRVEHAVREAEDGAVSGFRPLHTWAHRSRPRAGTVFPPDCRGDPAPSLQNSPTPTPRCSPKHPSTLPQHLLAVPWIRDLDGSRAFAVGQIPDPPGQCPREDSNVTRLRKCIADLVLSSFLSGSGGVNVGLPGVSRNGRPVGTGRWFVPVADTSRVFRLIQLEQCRIVRHSLCQPWPLAGIENVEDHELDPSGVSGTQIGATPHGRDQVVHQGLHVIRPLLLRSR